MKDKASKKLSFNQDAGLYYYDSLSGRDPLEDWLNKKDRESAFQSFLKEMNSIADPYYARCSNVIDVPVSYEGWTLLHWAAQRDDVELAKKLVTAGANLNARTFNVSAYQNPHFTPLILTAKNNSLKVAELLIDKGADMEAREAKQSFTPLLEAGFWENGEMCALLLSKGADLHAKDVAGRNVCKFIDLSEHRIPSCGSLCLSCKSTRVRNNFRGPSFW